MKILLVIVLANFGLAPSGCCQGYFILFNETAPTRLGSINGPLAGPGTWAQALAGRTSDSLEWVGMPVEHFGGGLTWGATTAVPWANPTETVFVQMVAWDGTLWGTNVANVPPNQFGRTDTVPVIVLLPTQPLLIPQFTQPAVVPAVPEPGTASLMILGVSFLWLVALRRRRSRATDR